MVEICLSRFLDSWKVDGDQGPGNRKVAESGERELDHWWERGLWIVLGLPNVCLVVVMHFGPRTKHF